LSPLLTSWCGSEGGHAVAETVFVQQFELEADSPGVPAVIVTVGNDFRLVRVDALAERDSRPGGAVPKHG
jgi:hypothetical protein